MIDFTASRPSKNRNYSVWKWIKAANVYRLLSTWRVPGTRQEVADIILDTTSVPLWWKNFRRIEIIEPGRLDGRGRKFRVVERSLLPYTVRFHCHVKRVQYPESFRVKVCGDFEGRGVLHIAEEGDQAILRFDWFIRVHKPLVRHSSLFLRRMLVVNHRWSMWYGRLGLIQEIAQRRMESLSTRSESRGVLPLSTDRCS